jgi:hypothetical protein
VFTAENFPTMDILFLVLVFVRGAVFGWVFQRSVELAHAPCTYLRSTYADSPSVCVRDARPHKALAE